MTRPSQQPLRAPRAHFSLRDRAGSQQGVALIAVLVFIGIVAAVFVLGSISADGLRARQAQHNADALEMARDALVAYAVNGSSTSSTPRPGALPCPDLDGDGQSLPGNEYVGNDCRGYIGRLPWRLLGIPELRDASGELLWYALSPAYRNAGLLSGNPGFVNPDTVAELSIAGTPGQFAAIVFAPGTALQGQDRSGVGATALENYLDGVNATPTTVFSGGPPGPAFNDRLLAVSVESLMAVAERRIAGQLAAALDDYFAVNGFLPSPARFDDPECVAAGTTPGCLPSALPLAGRIPANVAPDAYSTGATGRANALLRGDPAEPSWFHLQRWREHATYLVSPECVGPPANNCPAGSLNLRRANGGGNVDNARFIVLMGGIASPGQPRATTVDKGQLQNYLESAALTAAEVMRAGSVPTAISVPAGTAAAAGRVN